MTRKTKDVVLPDGRTYVVVDCESCYIQFEVDSGHSHKFELMNLYRFYEDCELAEDFDDDCEREAAARIMAFDLPIIIAGVSSEGREILMHGHDVLSAYGLDPRDVPGFIYFLDDEEELSWHTGEWLRGQKCGFDVTR